MKKLEALHILGLEDGASDEAIKQAHREQVRANHPDRFVQNSKKHEEALEKTKLINEARDVLLNKTWDDRFVQTPGQAGTPPYSSYSSGWSRDGQSYVWTWSSYDPGHASEYRPNSDFDNFPYDAFFAQVSDFFTPQDLTPEQKYAQARLRTRKTILVLFSLFVFAGLFSPLSGFVSQGLLLTLLILHYLSRYKKLSALRLGLAFFVSAPFLILVLGILGRFLSFGAGVFIIGLIYAAWCIASDLRTELQCKKELGKN